MPPRLDIEAIDLLTFYMLYCMVSAQQTKLYIGGGSLIQTLGGGGAVVNPNVDHHLNQIRLHAYILVHYAICY